MTSGNRPPAADRDRLVAVAYDVADKYRDDLLPGLEPNRDRSKDWTFMLDLLRRECPGFTDYEYRMALNDGFVSSR